MIIYAIIVGFNILFNLGLIVGAVFFLRFLWNLARRSRIAKGFIVCLVVWSALGIWVTFHPEYDLHCRRFDSAAWKTQKYDGDPQWPTRSRMVKDLVIRKLLDGKTRAEVEALLGKADSNGYNDNEICYTLGPERHLISIDSEILIIRFSDEGYVQSYTDTVS